jgi:hypothetical protein
MSKEDDGVITSLARMVRGNEHRRNDAQTDSLGCLSGGFLNLFPKKKSQASSRRRDLQQIINLKLYI